MQVADRCTVLRKGKCIGTVDIRDTNPEKLSAMMVGRDVNFVVEKEEAKPGEVVLDIKDMVVASKHHKNNAVNGVSLQVHRGEIVCITGIDGNGQTEFVYGLSGLEPLKSGTITMNGKDITHMPIRERLTSGMSISRKTVTNTAWYLIIPWKTTSSFRDISNHSLPINWAF